MVVYELWRENVLGETETSGAVWGQSNWFPVMNRASRKACVCRQGWRDASLSCASSLGADPEPGWGGGPLRLPRPQTNRDCAAPQTSASCGCFSNKWKNNVLEPRVKLNYLRKTLWTNTEGRGKPSDQSSSPGARQGKRRQLGGRTRSRTMSTTRCQVVGFLLSILGLAGCIVATEMDMWSTQDLYDSPVTAVFQYEGLWRSCVQQSSGFTECRPYLTILGLPGRRGHRWGREPAAAFTAARGDLGVGRRAGLSQHWLPSEV